MATTLQATSRDVQVIEALVHKVRLFAAAQIADGWWGGSISGARKRLAKLVQTSRVGTREVFAATPERMAGPIFTWSPNAPEPDLAAAAYVLERRARARRTKRLVVYTATRLVAARVGGFSGRLSHPAQAAHDLGVSAVWLKLFAESRDRAERWVGEELIRTEFSPGEAIPDAVIRDSGGADKPAIE